MKCRYACGSDDHRIARRSFLGGLGAATGGIMAGAGAMTGFTAFANPSVSTEMKGRNKQILLLFLAGGVSQLETWDPKPGAPTGGPFRAIPTSVPGTHICELLPHTAKQMHRLAIVRSVNTKENDHGKGHIFMETGRPQNPAVTYPRLGAVASHFLSPSNASLPGYIHISPGGGGVDRAEAAFLGPRYAPLRISGAEAPPNTKRADALTEDIDRQRHDIRRRINDRFVARRRTAETEVYSHSYEQALQLMEKRDLFDVSKAPEKERERYGSHDFGRHCLLAKRLIDNDATFVKVTHTNYDTHYENFIFHIEQLGEFDKTFATLIDDLSASGRLANTLIIVMSEFGRTPNINGGLGRDHWGTAWSVALGGCGIKGGAVVGATNPNGTAVVDREVHGGHLFHTYLKAVGVDPEVTHDVGGRPVQFADPTVSAVKEILA